MRIFLLFCFLITTLASLAQSSLNNARTLVVATYQYADNPRIKNIEPFATHFGDEAGIKTVVKSFPTVHALLEAMKNNEVDIVFINTFGYLLSRELTQAYEISAALHLPDDAASVYRSVIVSPKENQITTLKAAVDRAGDNYLVLVSPGSTSGNLVPRLKLASILRDDPEKFFVEVQYAERHDAALTLAREEKYAIASCGSDEYYKLGADTAKFNLLWKSEPIQLGPVLVKKELSENIKISLQKALLSLHEQSPAALESVKSGWTEAKPADRYVVIDDVYYESLIRLAGNPAKALRIIKKFAR
jgi:phosphonate transport system substrate-binding protein